MKLQWIEHRFHQFSYIQGKYFRDVLIRFAELRAEGPPKYIQRINIIYLSRSQLNSSGKSKFDLFLLSNILIWLHEEGLSTAGGRRSEEVSSSFEVLIFPEKVQF